LFGLLASTGLISLILNAVGQDQASVRLAQSVLVIVFLAGAVLTIVLRFPPQDRRQTLFVVGPALVAMSLGLLFPHLMLLFLPIAVGWIVIAIVGLRARVRREYVQAIRHLRNREYKEAIDIITEVIADEPKMADHYRFRAELYRLSARLKKAREDYQRVVDLQPDSGVGYNGLAEVYLQDGEFDAALPFAEKAQALEPNEWVPAYNLGMIQDRRGDWVRAIPALTRALELGIPDSRHRLLTHLWLARAHFHRGEAEQCDAAFAHLRREEAGLKEWHTIFESEEAAVLKAVLLEDVTLAGKLLDAKATVGLLAGSS
jgi:tetratricopeptide (TPR) repeat protein